MLWRYVAKITLLSALSALPFIAFGGDKKLDPKDDPDAIGNRNVGEGINFYSLEREIALGKHSRQKWSGRPRSSTIRSLRNT